MLESVSTAPEFPAPLHSSSPVPPWSAASRQRSMAAAELPGGTCSSSRRWRVLVLTLRGWLIQQISTQLGTQVCPLLEDHGLQARVLSNGTTHKHQILCPLFPPVGPLKLPSLCVHTQAPVWMSLAPPYPVSPWACLNGPWGCPWSLSSWRATMLILRPPHLGS